MPQCARARRVGAGQAARRGAVHTAVTNAGSSEYRPAVRRRTVGAEPRAHRPAAPQRRAGDRRRPPRRDPRGRVAPVRRAGRGGTTMAEIARRVGAAPVVGLLLLPQQGASVLGAIVAEANRAPLDARRRIAADGATPAVQLYRIIRADVVALCALPYDLNELHRLAARDPETLRRGTGGNGSSWSGASPVVRRRRRRGRVRDGRRPAHRAHRAVERRGRPELDARWGPRLRTGPIGLAVADLVVGGLLVAPRTLPRCGESPPRSIVPPGPATLDNGC